jgi:DNA-binding NarL/FixJ family response regulator
VKERETPPGIRLLVVEDHRVVREGLVTLIERQPDMTVVGEARTGAEAVETYRKARPSVVLMDLSLPGTDGFEATREILALDPDAGVVVLTAHEGDESVYRALEAGAKGYLWKGAGREDLLQAIRAVAAGRRWIAPGVSSRLVELLPRVDLTPRERAVLQRMALGESNREIGNALGIAESTVKVHASAILSRLGARDRTEAVMIALRRGILHGSGASD